MSESVQWKIAEITNFVCVCQRSNSYFDICGAKEEVLNDS